MTPPEILCWVGFVVIAAITFAGVISGICACMLSSDISQELGEE